ncbi:Acid phosphatase 1 [Quillaja saponaria]|uniref:Acid phosphatase 1 n=1 Tax=Quillaja saponaria TaxID=32244 RepID=A0AAD7M3X2_QUISA|nr:Acid phosphatase 1 [Quillaja saponaria]
MDFRVLLFSFLLIAIIIPGIFSESIIRIPPEKDLFCDRKSETDDRLYCESWRFSIETNDAGAWQRIPARAGDGKDAWVFDIDETLLSNLPYYEVHGFGSEPFDEKSFDDWVNLAEAPALPASLSLYEELSQLGFKIFLLTGRSEYQRDATERNLLFAGYRNWEKLILRGPSDQGTPATVYKSEKRANLVNEGYRIQGSSGDQWSDLWGFAIATRSFKLPNPMYYIA